MAKDGALFGWEAEYENYKNENPFHVEPLAYKSDETLESICVKTADIGNALGAIGELAEYYRQRLAYAEKRHMKAYRQALLAHKNAGNAQLQKAAAENSANVEQAREEAEKAEHLYKMAQVALTALEIQFTALRKIGALRMTSARNLPE